MHFTDCNGFFFFFFLNFSLFKILLLTKASRRMHINHIRLAVAASKVSLLEFLTLNSINSDPRYAYETGYSAVQLLHNLVMSAG